MAAATGVVPVQRVDVVEPQEPAQVGQLLIDGPAQVVAEAIPEDLLDVTGEAVKNNGMENMPATVSAIGDVYGVTQLLYLIQHGSRLLEISELTVRPNPALRGELLQLTVTLRGPFVTEATP